MLGRTVGRLPPGSSRVPSGTIKASPHGEHIQVNPAQASHVFFFSSFFIGLMWDVLLYLCCFYWLMNKAVLANGLAE